MAAIVEAPFLAPLPECFRRLVRGPDTAQTGHHRGVAEDSLGIPAISLVEAANQQPASTRMLLTPRPSSRPAGASGGTYARGASMAWILRTWRPPSNGVESH